MVKTKEAFKDKKFLESPEGRSIRILAEYEKVKSVFEIHKIIDTITFFGSARIKATEDSKNLTDEKTQYYERARELHLNLQVGQRNIQIIKIVLL